MTHSKLSQHDPVFRPQHYTFGAIEVIAAIEAWSLGFHLGNVVKYLARAAHKGKYLEDLRKARWYLDREIERAELAGATNNRYQSSGRKQTSTSHDVKSADTPAATTTSSQSECSLLATTMLSQSDLPAPDTSIESKSSSALPPAIRSKHVQRRKTRPTLEALTSEVPKSKLQRLKDSHSRAISGRSPE